MQRAKRLVPLAMVALLAAPCGGEQAPAWKALHLESTTIAGATVHYEKPLAGGLDDFGAVLKQWLAAEARRGTILQRVLARSDRIVRQVNRIVGLQADEPTIRWQRQMLSALLRHSLLVDPTRQKLTLYLVTRDRTKDYLRKGGTLPGFSYDKGTDTARYELAHRMESSRPQARKVATIAIPVGSLKDLEQDARLILAGITRSNELSFGMALHELAESAIVHHRLRPYDPYFRWFTDGFANVIAARLIKDHVSKQAAEHFLEGHDPARYSDLAGNINLYYWMGLGFCIDTPLPAEKRLEQARYAYATAEAQRLVDAHGMKVVRAILDKACSESSNDSRQLVAAVREVTGEDIEKRFRRYQSFQTAAEGLKEYAAEFDAAMEKKDYAAALSNLLRALELKYPADLRCYSNAASLLFRMGHEAAGDRAIKKQMALLKRRKMDKEHFVMQMLFVDYAAACRRFEKAYDMAEEVLAKRPDFVPALLVRMDRLGSSGRIAEAKKIAARVVELEKNAKSFAHRFATSVLDLKEQEQ